MVSDAKLCNNIANYGNQLEFTLETRFARYQSKFSLISGIKKNFASLKKNLMFYAPSMQQILILMSKLSTYKLDELLTFCGIFSSVALK